MKILVIPDIHLKPWIIKKAEKKDYEYTVFLGDLADDWGQCLNYELYEETYHTAAEYAKIHRSFWCYGNHDISYVWGKKESGYSDVVRDAVLHGVKELENVTEHGFIKRIDNLIFSHAGVTDIYVDYYFETSTEMDHVLKEINNFGIGQLWVHQSPIWARPHLDDYKSPWPEILQVIGHTPVKEPYVFNGFLALDTFSKRIPGKEIKKLPLVWVDSKTKEWGYVE